MRSSKPKQELLLFLLAILLCIHFPGFYCQKYDCTQPFQCGSIRNIRYPFWGGSRPEDCGRSGFQLLNCTGDFPLLEIPPLRYRVLELNFSTHTLKVARQDLLDNFCPAVLYNTTLNNLYRFAPNSTDKKVTLFFNCVIHQNGSGTFLPNQFVCNEEGPETINLFRIGDALSGPGPNITCEGDISVPVNQAAAEALENRTASPIGALQEALAGGFLIQWSTAPVVICQNGICTAYAEMQGNVQVVAASPVYQEEPRVPIGAPAAAPTATNFNDGERYRRPQRIYIGVVVVCGAGAIIISIIICCCCLIRRCSQQGSPDGENIENFLVQHGSLAPKRYKYSEIKKITKSFKHKLGQGGYGSVYQGILPDGCPVAVKVLVHADSNGEEFINEVASISRTSHVNIVNLLGFCYDRNKRALVYEFMPNKSLDKFISNKADCQLDWEKLYNIAVGVAKGLEYLHTGCNTRIVHFDIKPQNILLDDDFCPKISDFGLAKLCKKKQSILSVLGARGTIGYIAPEVFSRNFGGVSHKSDVYSYGMMVLEMAGARKIVEPVATTHSSDNYFPDRIYEQVVLDVARNLDDIMIEGEEETGRKMFLVGFWCIQTTPSDRPSMSKVVEMLEGSLQSIPIPPKPFLFSPSFPTSGPEISSTLPEHADVENSVEAKATTLKY